MTNTFSHFKNQLHSKGSQKADGYDKSHFDGLNENEKNEAFNLLKKESVAPGVPEWIFYLNRSKAKEYFDDYIEKNNSETPGIHRVYFQLYIETKEKHYQNLLINNFFNYPNRDSREALWLINGCDFENFMKIELLKKIILNHSPTKAVITASDFYLRLNGFNLSTQEEKDRFYEIRSLLSSNSIDSKMKAITKIENNVNKNF